MKRQTMVLIREQLEEEDRKASDNYEKDINASGLLIVKVYLSEDD